MSFVALLRAVNVGGTKLPMADLRALLEGLGLANVRTYLQSGNAVFDAGDDTEPASALATAIEMRIERDLGPRVGVLVLPGECIGRRRGRQPVPRRRRRHGDPARDLPLRAARRGRLRRGVRRRLLRRVQGGLQQAGAAGGRGRRGGVRRGAAAGRSGHLPEAAARLRAHQAEQRLVRAQAGHGGHHQELADGGGSGGRWPARAELRIAGPRPGGSVRPPGTFLPGSASSASRATPRAAPSPL